MHFPSPQAKSTELQSDVSFLSLEYLSTGANSFWFCSAEWSEGRAVANPRVRNTNTTELIDGIFNCSLSWAENLLWQRELEESTFILDLDDAYNDNDTNNNTIIYYRGTLSGFKHSITIILLEATLISDTPLCNEVQVQLDLHVQPAYQ